MRSMIFGLQIRELLEKLLDDDDDMRDMNLAAKCALPQLVEPEAWGRQPALPH